MVGIHIGERFRYAGFGFVVGAGAAYLFDPQRGASRRAKLRDETSSRIRHLAVRMRRQSADLQHRARGAFYELKLRLQHERVPDDILIERVRAQLGRPVSHPRMIEVESHNGCVTLKGEVLANELGALLFMIGRIRGVEAIDNRLQPYGREDALNRLAGRRGTAHSKPIVEHQPVLQ